MPTRSPGLSARTGMSCSCTATGCSGRRGRRGRAAGDLAVGLAGAARLRGARVDPDLAVPGCHQPVHGRAPVAPPPPAPVSPPPDGLRRRSRPGPARCRGWSPTQTTCSPDSPTARPARKPGTSPREAISLAFITALQLLPPRQRAAACCATCSASVPGRPPGSWTSARSPSPVRSSAPGRRSNGTGRAQQPAPPPGSPAERELVERLTAAFESADVDAIVAHDDRRCLADHAAAAPGVPGPRARRWVPHRHRVPPRLDRLRLIPARANGQPRSASTPATRTRGAITRSG